MPHNGSVEDDESQSWVIADGSEYGAPSENFSKISKIEASDHELLASFLQTDIFKKAFDNYQVRMSQA